MTARIDTGALLLGRLALAACVAPSGIAHAMNISGFAALLAKQGLPFAQGLATAGVLIEVFGPLAFVLGLAPRLSAALLVLVEVCSALALHRFWSMGGAARLRAPKRPSRSPTARSRARPRRLWRPKGPRLDPDLVTRRNDR